MQGLASEVTYLKVYGLADIPSKCRGPIDIYKVRSEDNRRHTSRRCIDTIVIITEN